MKPIGNALERLMQTTPDMRHQAALEQHRRESRREIWLPAAIGIGVLVLAVLAAAFISTQYAELRLISNFVLTLLILCPAALLTFPLAIVLVIAAVGMNRVHDWSEDKVSGLNRVSYSVNRRIDSVMNRLGQAGVTIGTAAAPLEAKVFSAFDRPTVTDVNEEKYGPAAKRTTDEPTKTG
jgi:hypothetical protein